MSSPSDLPSLTKVDSAIAGVSPSSPTQEKRGHRRSSSSVTGVYNPKELEEKQIPIEIAVETQQLAWKINTSPSTIEDKEALKKPLCTPLVKKMDLHFPLGLEVTARNLKGVTIKDACDAIYKQYKKKQDDELEAPYLRGFEWDKDECYTRFIVHQTKQVAVAPVVSKKNNNKKKKEQEAPEDVLNVKA